MAVTHSTVATAPDDPDAEINAAEWNDDHVVTGLAAATHSHAGADITSGTVADARIASTLARDSEVTSAISTHEGLSDPHPGYTTAAELAATKIDDLTAGDDNTDLDATTGHHGLLPKLGGGSTNFLRADGTWAAPGGGGVASAHGCRVRRASTGFSVGNNTLTAIAFDAEDYDTDTIHDNSTNNTRLTIPAISGVTTGLWTIIGSAYTDKTAADGVLRLNGSTNLAFYAQNGFGCVLVVMDYVCTAGDYFEFLIRTPLGAGNAVFDAGISPIFSIKFIGKVS